MKRKKLCICIFILLIVVSILVFGSGHSNDKYYIKSDEGEKISIEEYIKGVMMSFIPVDYNEQTMKAVAVMIRTYLMQEFVSMDENVIDMENLKLGYTSPNTMRSTLGNDIFEDTMQKYSDAVEATKGEVIKYDGKLIVPLYHEVSAGSTRDASKYFDEDIPYMKSVRCNQDVESEDYLKVTEIEKKEFYEIVSQLTGSNEQKIPDLIRDEADYVVKAEFGKGEISGEVFASRFDLNSSCFYIEESGDYIKIITKGQGCGMGMSIFGAQCLGKQGYDYKAILKYFYAGVDVE